MDLVRVHAPLDQLERRPLLEPSVRPLGEIHRAHAAAPQLPQHAVRADAHPLERGAPLVRLDQRGGKGGGRCVEKTRHPAALLLH